MIRRAQGDKAGAEELLRQAHDFAHAHALNAK
jgi:hypothetical protein